MLGAGRLGESGNKFVRAQIYRETSGPMDRTRQFEALALPHLDAAYNLARWLLRDDDSAQDAVQDAFLRAFRYFDSFVGQEMRPWLLGIVRNTCFTLLQARRDAPAQMELDEEHDFDGVDATIDPAAASPEALLVRKIERASVMAAIDALPVVFREAIVLREIEDLSYQEIAQIAGVPMGTVMSRLSRARAMLRAILLRGETAHKQ